MGGEGADADDSRETVLWKGAYAGACRLVEVAGGDEEGSWSVYACVVGKVDQVSGGGGATQACLERGGGKREYIICVCMHV